MRTCSLVVVLFLSLPAASFSMQRQAITLDTNTPEGQLLQQFLDASDDAHRAVLAEQFLAQYPKHEGALWVYSQMVASYTKLGQFDKALAAAEKVLALDPADVETAYAGVKAAEAAKDPDTVRKWAILSSDLARKVAQAPKTGDEDDDAYKHRVDSAKHLDLYTEYALFNSAVQTPDPAKKVALLKTLEERAPESGYLARSYGLYFQALAQSGDLPAAVGLAEKLIAKGQANEEMLATAADYYVRQNREPQKVLDYSSRLLAAVNTRQKPDGVGDDDWQKWKTNLLGWGQWMMGIAYGVQGKYADSNKVLREALPLLEGNDERKAGALYNLGIDNSHLRNVTDAGKFFEQCAALNSPYQTLCADNFKAIRSTYRVVK